MGLLDLAPDWLLKAWDRRNRIGYEGRARLCSDDHVPIYVLGMERRKQPVHLDVELEMWNGGREPVSFRRGIESAVVAGQVLQEGTVRISGDGFRAVSLEVGAPPLRTHFRLRPKEGALGAKVGDELRVTLRPTRGRSVKLRVSVTEQT